MNETHDSENNIPAALAAVAFAIALWASQFVHAPALSAAGLTVVATLLVSWRKPSIRGLIVAIAMLALGLARGASDHQNRIDHERSLRQFDGERFVEIKGRTGSGWQRTATGGFRLTTERSIVRQDDIDVDVDLPITIYTSSQPPFLDRESILHAEGFLKRREDGRWIVTVKSSQLMRYSGRMSVLWPKLWNRLAAERLDHAARGDERLQLAADLAKALVLGRSDQLSYEVRQSYRDGGTYHLLVFSGMQITLAAGFIVLLLRWMRAPRVADWTVLSISILAPLFAGNAPSVTRASMMIGLYALSRLLRRPTSIANLLFVSAMLRLLLYPRELTDAGFVLTYVATGGVIVVGEAAVAFVARRGSMLHLIVRGAATELTMAPTTLLLFNRVVVGSSIATLIAAPIVALMLGFSALLTIVAIAAPSFGVFAGEPLLFLHMVCVKLNALFASTLDVNKVALAPPVLFVAAAYVSTVFLFALLPRRLRLAGVVPLVIVLLATPFTGRGLPVDFRVEALDVGQGDALLVSAGGTVALIDGGGSAEDPGFGERRVVPMLLARGITRLDAVALSHAHPDHCGGLPGVLREIDVGELWLSGKQWRDGCTADLFELAASRGIVVRVIEHRERVLLGPMIFHVLKPRLRFKKARVNNGSIVYRVQHGSTALLLTGDIERDAERMLAEEASELRADILKVAHHGSRTSTTNEFLKRVKPRVAIISCGRRNLYGHPNREVLDRLGAHGTRVLRTDLNGSVTIVKETLNASARMFDIRFER